MSNSDHPISNPKHLGIILDGNRRWARSKGLTTFEGHSKGYDNLKQITSHAFKKGVKYVSAFVFSTENWDRTRQEVNYLMSLALKILTKDVDELDKENVKIVWLGQGDKLSLKMLKALERAEEKTKNNTKGTLCICLNYGGQQEITDAAKKLLDSGISPEDIDSKMLSDNLYRPDVPPMDLLIRTSGERRLSGFMLWRVAYTELYFTDKHWPEFSKEDLELAFDDYRRRDRRFGK